MNKTITLLILIMLSILSLYASDNTPKKRGFTVTYLMLEKHNIALPSYQEQEDTNCTETLLKGGDSEIK